MITFGVRQRYGAGSSEIQRRLNIALVYSPAPDHCSLQLSSIDLQCRAWRKNDRALDDIFKLADVARPGISHERVHHLGWDRFDPPSHSPGDLLCEMAHQS